MKATTPDPNLIDPRRSALMAKVKGRNTLPEMRVRCAAHALGARFRLHRRDLPGTPDLVFPSRRLALFVHGCFWHRHEGCRRATSPRTRAQFWSSKFEANVERDRRNERDLQVLGWRVAAIWECEARDSAVLDSRLRAVLYPDGVVNATETDAPPK
ncbi:MAG: DNA mismatch endonuclease Vsr [Phenylobacterium sp.]|nr:MAG: DNA mismatch endonuclease Vsr [Phenylobacterium sp.]